MIFTQHQIWLRYITYIDDVSLYVMFFFCYHIIIRVFKLLITDQYQCQTQFSISDYINVTCSAVTSYF